MRRSIDQPIKSEEGVGVCKEERANYGIDGKGKERWMDGLRGRDQRFVEADVHRGTLRG